MLSILYLILSLKNKFSCETTNWWKSLISDSLIVTEWFNYSIKILIEIKWSLIFIYLKFISHFYERINEVWVNHIIISWLFRSSNLP